MKCNPMTFLQAHLQVKAEGGLEKCTKLQEIQI